MNHSLRARSAHDVGEGWTAADATELYEIARWGQGYFAIGDNGQVKIHHSQPYIQVRMRSGSKTGIFM